MMMKLSSFVMLSSRDE
jgi:hypothetical protein